QEGTDLKELGNFRSYDDIQKLTEYLDPSNKALRLSSNVNKLSHSRQRANLDARSLKNIQDEMVSASIMRSASTIVKKVGGHLEKQRAELDMLRVGIGEFVNSKAGKKFFNSTDFYVRDMGHVGLIASNIGKDLLKQINDSIKMIRSYW